MPAVVVGYERLPNSDGSKSTRYPVVQFNGPTGEPVTARSDFGGDLVPKIGQRVVVLQDPDRPDQVHIESRTYDRLHLGAAVLCWGFLAGGVALVVARSDRLVERIVGVTELARWRESALLLIASLLLTAIGITVGTMLILYARRLRREPEHVYRDGQRFRTGRHNALIAAMGWITAIGFPLGAVAVLIAVNSLL